jgi:hypothetical protein
MYAYKQLLQKEETVEWRDTTIFSSNMQLSVSVEYKQIKATSRKCGGHVSCCQE